MTAKSALAEILNMIEKLSAADRLALKTHLTKANPSGKNTNIERFLAEERHSKGRACPHCGSIDMVRNGHRKDGTQRFKCKDCGKSFVVATNSIVAGTRKDISVWEKCIACMMHGLSIRESAEICGIHRNTAFYWRHKILDALQSIMEDIELDGIVEMDETFFPVSYKGNHSKNKDFEMPRLPHKRGGETHLRGLSHEKVCVPCAVNRNGSAIAMISNLGRIATKNIHAVFDGKIAEDAVLVTDKMNSYVRFANANELKLVQLKDGKSKGGIYNIQRINSYHSTLKRFMGRFNGVSTKYLNNYLVWHNLVNYAREANDEKRNMMMRYALTALKSVFCREISKREPIPVLG